MSVLGLGTARLPLEGAVSTEIIRHAIDRGVNYLDVPYVSDAEKRQALGRLIGSTLADGYRQRVKVALALPVSVIGSPDDFNRYLDEQLESLGTDNVDFGIIGWLDRQNWPGLKEAGVLSWLDSSVQDGKIKHVGFAFHDDYQTLRDILNAHDNWALCQVKYSFMDVDHHPGVGGIRLAAENGLAIVVSEPLKSGRFTRNIPPGVSAVWAEASPPRSPTEWALPWVWHHPEITVAVSNMSTLEQLKENIALADVAAANSLSVLEQVLVNKVRDAYQAMKPFACTACRGCMPCPRDIDVPRIFELYNDAVMYDDVEIFRTVYREEGHDIDRCNECGLCEDACGRNIAITEWLKKAGQLFETSDP